MDNQEKGNIQTRDTECFLKSTGSVCKIMRFWWYLSLQKQTNKIRLRNTAYLRFLVNSSSCRFSIWYSNVSISIWQFSYLIKYFMTLLHCFNIYELWVSKHFNSQTRLDRGLDLRLQFISVKCKIKQLSKSWRFPWRKYKVMNSC